MITVSAMKVLRSWFNDIGNPLVNKYYLIFRQYDGYQSSESGFLNSLAKIL